MNVCHDFSQVTKNWSLGITTASTARLRGASAASSTSRRPRYAPVNHFKYISRQACPSMSPSKAPLPVGGSAPRLTLSTSRRPAAAPPPRSADWTRRQPSTTIRPSASSCPVDVPAPAGPARRPRPPLSCNHDASWTDDDSLTVTFTRT